MVITSYVFTAFQIVLSLWSVSLFLWPTKRKHAVTSSKGACQPDFCNDQTWKGFCSYVCSCQTASRGNLRAPQWNQHMENRVGSLYGMVTPILKFIHLYEYSRAVGRIRFKHADQSNVYWAPTVGLFRNCEMKEGEWWLVRPENSIWVIVHPI